jgi:hypothetical protein
MSVAAKLQMGMQTVETIATSQDFGESTIDYTHNLNSTAQTSSTLTAATTPPATKAYSDRITLAAGTHTLDLTSMVGPFGAAVTFNTLKIQQLYIKAASTNTAVIVVSQNVATPYFLLGVTGDTLSLHAGTEVMFKFGAGVLAAAGAGAKWVDFDSTDLDAIFDIHIVAGI